MKIILISYIIRIYNINNIIYNYFFKLYILIM